MPLRHTVAFYRTRHLNGTLPRYCARIRRERPVPFTLIGVVLGHLSINYLGQIERHGFDLRAFERDDPYWYLTLDPEDPLHEYRQLMRNDLAESQLHARSRRAALKAALRYRLTNPYAQG